MAKTGYVLIGMGLGADTPIAIYSSKEEAIDKAIEEIFAKLPLSYLEEEYYITPDNIKERLEEEYPDVGVDDCIYWVEETLLDE